MKFRVIKREFRIRNLSLIAYKSKWLMSKLRI